MKTMQRNGVERMAGQINQIMDKLWRWDTNEFCPVDSWAPPVNVYRFERRIEVCVDLAGVDRKHIEVRVKPGLLEIRGIRYSPEPKREESEAMQIYAMEINHGRFCRTIRLPDLIALDRVDSNYADGYLWIRLPFSIQK